MCLPQKPKVGPMAAGARVGGRKGSSPRKSDATAAAPSTAVTAPASTQASGWFLGSALSSLATLVVGGESKPEVCSDTERRIRG